MKQSFRLALLLLVASTALLVACGGSSRVFPEVTTLKEGQVLPILANSEIVVGKNRIAIGVLDATGVPIVDATVHFTFYDLSNGEEVKKFDMDAVSRVPARDARAIVLGWIDASGYDGWVSAEYRPKGTTEEGLGWMGGTHA